MAGDAGGNGATLIAALVNELSRLPVRGIRLETGRRLRRKVHGKIINVGIGKRYGKRRHDRVIAHLGAKQAQLLGHVDGTLAGKRWPRGVGTVAIRAVAAETYGGFGCTALHRAVVVRGRSPRAQPAFTKRQVAKAIKPHAPTAMFLFDIVAFPHPIDLCDGGKLYTTVRSSLTAPDRAQ